jgi:hypothetical protein
MPIRRRLLCALALAGAALTLVLAAAPAPSASGQGLPPGITIPKFTPLVLTKATYTSTTKWNVIPEQTGRCNTYVRGDGTQYVAIELAKPTRYSLAIIGGTESLMPAAAPPTFTSTATRTANWDPHFDECACGPKSEYGPCDDADPQASYDCTPQRNGVPRLDVRNYDEGDKLPNEQGEAWKPMFVLTATGGKVFGESCPPFDSNIRLGTDGLVVAESGADIRRLAALKPGHGMDIPFKVSFGMRRTPGGEPLHTFQKCPSKPKAGSWYCKRNTGVLHFERP